MREPGVELGERARGELVSLEGAFGILFCLGGLFGAGGCVWEAGSIGLVENKEKELVQISLGCWLFKAMCEALRS